MTDAEALRVIRLAALNNPQLFDAVDTIEHRSYRDGYDDGIAVASGH